MNVGDKRRKFILFDHRARNAFWRLEYARVKLKLNHLTRLASKGSMIPAATPDRQEKKRRMIEAKDA